MHKEQVREYILKYQDSYSKEAIENQLISSGFATKKIVDEVFKEMDELPPAPYGKKKSKLGLVLLIFLFLVLAVGGIYAVMEGESLLLKYNIIDPADKYFDYVEKQDTIDEFKVVYKMSFDAIPMLSAANMNVGLFKKGTNQKTVAEVSIMGMQVKAYTYDVDGQVISCASEIGSRDDEIECKLGDNDEMDEFMSVMSRDKFFSEDMQNNVKVTYVGEKKVADSMCNEFSVEILDIEKFYESMGENEVFEEAGENLKALKFETCFDKKTGMMLNMEIFSKSDSELLDDDEFTEMMSFKAVSFSDTVDELEFVLPVDLAVVSSACNKDELVVVVSAFNELDDDLSLNFVESDYDYETYERVETVTKSINLPDKKIAKGGVETFEIDLKDSESSTSSFQFCNGDDCVSGSCYASYSSNNDDKLECVKLSGNEPSCTVNPKCVFKDSLCEVFKCSLLDEKDDCEGNSGCVWSDSFGSGYCAEKTCYTFEDESSCQSSDLGCSWSGYSCSKTTCYSLKDESSCESSDLGCTWSGYSCSKTSCYSFKDEESCKASDLDCAWNGYCYTDYS